MNTTHRPAGGMTRAVGMMTLLGALSVSAWAHGGEEHVHADEAAPTAGVAMASRAIAQTPDFELVAVLVGQSLTLTLDKFASNEPIADAQIEVESGSALNAPARQLAPGVYSVPGEAFAKPGKYPLTVSIQAGDTADLLTATLNVPAPMAAGADPAPTRTGWAVWGGAAALLLAGAALLAALRHRRKSSSHQE